MSWVRRLVIALGALVLLTGIVLVALVLFINPNDYKSTLVDLVKERYDRTLVIDGDIRLSVMPRLGLEIGGVSISEPHSNQVFAAVDSARASVAFWPLFSRHLIIEHLTLSGVKANVVRDAGGRFNFDDLLHAPAPAGAPVPANGASADGSIQLAVGSVNVSGGDVALRDEGNDMALRLERLNVSATGIAAGEAFDVNAAARLLGQSPRADATVQLQGRLGIEAAQGRYALRGLDLRMAGVLPSVRANAFGARGDVTYAADSGTLTLANVAVGFQGDLAFATPLTNVDAQLTAPQLVLDLPGERVEVEGLAGKAQGRMGEAPFTTSVDVPRLAVDEQTASGGPLQVAFAQEGEAGVSARLSLTGISGAAGRLAVAQAQLQASLQRQGRTARLELTSAATGSLTGRSLTLPALEATARIEGAGMPAAGLVVPVSGRLAADAGAGTLDSRLVAALPGGDLTLTAKASDLLAAVPALTFDLSANALDIDALWPPLPAESAAATPAPARAPAAEPAPPAETPVDLSALQQLNAQGRFRVAALTVREVAIRDLSGRIALADGRAVLSDLSAQVFEGRLTGQASAEAGTQRLSATGRWAGVALQPMLTHLTGKDSLSGRGDLRWSLASTGKTVEAMRRGLDGELALDVRNGALRGVNVAQSLRDFRALIGSGEPDTQAVDRERTTDFSELRAVLDIAQGTGTLRDVYVAAPLLRITESSPATVDLVNERLDVLFDARVVNTSSGQDGKALEALRGVTVPILVSGPWQAPEYTVQWNRVAARTLSQTLEREAGRQLERLLGGRERDEAPPEAGSNSEEAAREAGKLLGNALKGLFNP